MILKKLMGYLRVIWLRLHYPHITKSSMISRGVNIYNPNNIYMEENTNINPGAIIRNTKANFVMKKGSGAAHGLTVSTGNHMSIPGLLMKQVTEKIKEKYDINHEYNNDVVVEEDVWIASNVTLLSGVTIGRGGVIGAGAVIRKNTPPYSLVLGNPAKVVGFRFTPAEVVEHEKFLYPEEERLSIELLEKNYQKYYIKRIKEIKDFLKQ